MVKYKLYASDGSGWGEPDYIETIEYDEPGAEIAALHDAWLCACEEFDSSSLAPTWEEYVEDEGEEDATGEGFEEYYNEVRESSVDYKVELVK